MTTEFDVSMVRTTCGLLSSDELQRVYDQRLLQIEEKKREIELDQQILEILEKEDTKRRCPQH